MALQSLPFLTPDVIATFLHQKSLALILVNYPLLVSNYKIGMKHFTLKTKIKQTWTQNKHPNSINLRGNSANCVKFPSTLYSQQYDAKDILCISLLIPPQLSEPVKIWIQKAEEEPKIFGLCTCNFRVLSLQWNPWLHTVASWQG